MQATGGPTGAYRLSTQLSGVFLKGNRPHRTHIPPFSCAFFFLFSFPFFYSYNPGLLNRRRAPYRPPFFTLVKSVFDWLSHGPWPAALKSLWSRTVASFISKNDPRIWVWRNRWSITSVCVCSFHVELMADKWRLAWPIKQFDADVADKHICSFLLLGSKVNRLQIERRQMIHQLLQALL